MKKTSVLIAEDEAILAIELEGRLKKMGYDVSCSVAFGEQAIIKAEENAPDIVLMDVHLAGETDGIEAADRIRSRFNIPVVYLTAYSDEETLKRARTTEPFGYLLKPFQERELYTTIEMALHKHKIEMKLKEREERLSTILNNIGDGVISTDADGGVTFMNPVAERLTGLTQKECVGRDITRALNIKVLESRKQRDLDTTETLQKSIVFGLTEDIFLVSNDGRETPIIYRVVPIKGDNKKDVFGGVIVITDITERMEIEEKKRQYNENLEREVEKLTSELIDTLEELKRSKEQLTQSEKMASLGQLAAGIAHEINNPLGFISSNFRNLSKFYDRINSLLDILDMKERPERIIVLNSTINRSNNYIKNETTN